MFVAEQQQQKMSEYCEDVKKRWGYEGRCRPAIARGRQIVSILFGAAKHVIAGSELE